MTERWRDVPGVDGMEASDQGRVRRTQVRILKPWDNRRGYPSVDVRGKTWTVHRLVALAWVSNPQKHPIINHKNGVKRDPRASNLEWCTQSENLLHAYRLGLKRFTPAMRTAVTRTACTNARQQRRFTKAQASEIRRRAAGGETHASIARSFKAPYVTVSKIAAGDGYAGC